MFIQVDHLTKTYTSGEQSFFALNQACFEMEQGEIGVILGPSGSGKSTLMNIIGGLETATSGSVSVGDQEITSLKANALGIYRRKYVGFIFQFYNLIPNLTVRENVQLCAHLKENPLDIDELLEKVGLTLQQDKFPSQLSGGQQQRVAIARALIKNPQLLLCDEPTGALDSKTSIEVLSLFQEINQSLGTTILMITHNNLIAQMAHHVIRIKDGTVIENHHTHSPLNVHDIQW